MYSQFVIKQSRLRDIFTIVSLLLFSGAFLSQMRGTTEDGYNAVTGDTTSQVIFLVIYIISALLIVQRGEVALSFLRRNGLLLLLSLLALVSVVWSNAPLVTLRQSIALLGTALFGIYFATYYDLRQQVNLLLWTIGIVIVFSYLFVFLIPQLGQHTSYDGAWRGVFNHKNMFGRVLAAYAILNLALIWQTGTRKILYGSLFAVAMVTIYFSHSVTSLFSVALLLALYPVFGLLQRGIPSTIVVYFLVITLLLISLITMLYMDQIELLLNFFGKSTTLTGRTELWQVLIPFIERKLWSGYGYGAFWLRELGESYAVWFYLRWQPMHGHNGLLDLQLELGLLGTTLFLLTLILGLVRAIRVVSLSIQAKYQVAGALWPLAYLIYFIIINSTQSQILQTNNLFWLLYLSTLLTSDSAAREIEVAQRTDREMLEIEAANLGFYHPNPVWQ